MPAGSPASGDTASRKPTWPAGLSCRWRDFWAPSGALPAYPGKSDFYRGLSAYEAGSFALAVKPYQAESRVDSTMSGMGMLAMNMLLLSSFTSINLIKDRENRTFIASWLRPCA